MKTDNELPELTSLQFLVMEVIGAHKVRGADIRDRLKREHGVNKTGPAFYQLMARLEESKFAEGWYEQEIIDGQIIKQRFYKVTGLGERARRETLKFYSQFGEGRLAHA